MKGTKQIRAGRIERYIEKVADRIELLQRMKWSTDNEKLYAAIRIDVYFEIIAELSQVIE